MTQTHGSNAKVRWDKPKDRLNPARTHADVQPILALIVEVRQAWGDAVDGGVYPPQTETGGTRDRLRRHRPDPLRSHPAYPAPAQRSGTVRRGLIAEAKERLEDAAQVLHNGLLRTDPEVLAEHLEKRRAATQQVARRRSDVDREIQSENHAIRSIENR